MSMPLKREAVLAIFGTQAGTKLLNLLGACCGSQPAIQIAFNATCAGVDPKTGEQTYNVTASATYNTSIPGITSLFGYFSTQPYPNWSNITSAVLSNFNLNEGSIFVTNIVAGVPCVLANLTGVKLTAGNYYFMVTDNRGNYSNLLTVTVPNCASSPSTPASSAPSTPASQKTESTS
jgi:hypothetical protein